MPSSCTFRQRPDARGRGGELGLYAGGNERKVSIFEKAIYALDNDMKSGCLRFAAAHGHIRNQGSPSPRVGNHTGAAIREEPGRKPDDVVTGRRMCDLKARAPRN
jgi:hypothetical protein